MITVLASGGGCVCCVEHWASGLKVTDEYDDLSTLDLLEHPTRVDGDSTFGLDGNTRTFYILPRNVQVPWSFSSVQLERDDYVYGTWEYQTI